jgi:hypothetical protein
MLAADDQRWSTLKGGYRMPLDPRPLVSKLEDAHRIEEAWRELWDELHHQGDVGEASYAAVPLLVNLHRRRGVPDWNTYAIVSTIELARTENRNPEVPVWLSGEYFSAIQELATIALSEIRNQSDSDAVQAMLSVIALAKGLRTHAKFLINFAEDELQEIELKALE